jgi:hypothetical protein
MKNFTIENETNNIMIHGSAKEAGALPNTERFSNEAALAKLAADWPAARLVEIWNSLPGETQIKKFKDRATAVSRIWKAIQNLDGPAPLAEETIVVPEQARISDFRKRLSRRRSFQSLRTPPLTRPLRHTRPTLRRKRPPLPRRPPARKRRPSPRPRKKLVRPGKVARPAR